MFGFGKKKVAPPEAQSINAATMSLRRLNAWMAFGLVGIIAISAAVVYTFAAQVDNRRDLMSNQTKGEIAAHEISFNLSGGNTFIVGEQITLDFPETSGFGLDGTWAAGDFTFNDGTARTIAGVNQGPGVSTVVCPDGANNVGVALDTVGVVYRVIPCGASFVASGAGAFVTLDIFGEFPNGRLINPTTAGSYTINMLSGAGDCQTVGDLCNFTVSIVERDNIRITAQVGPDAPPTGGGGGGGQDLSPPVISDIHTENPTTNSIQVCWTTDENSNSHVNWGTTGAYGQTPVSSASMVTQHCVTLSNLTEGQTYHYQVCSTDSSGNQACSLDQTFTLPDNTPPVISDVVVGSVTCSSANFTWSTNEPSTTFVDYGPIAGPPYGATAGNASMVTSHNLLITGLSAGQTYHYRVRSGDAATNESFTADATFATTVSCAPDTTAPIISNVTVTNITKTSARVCWDTNEIANGQIEYGDTPSYGLVENDGNYVVQRCIDLTGLAENTLYHYQLTSVDPSGNQAETTDLTFTTLATVPGECSVDCSQAEFFPYIINPDGTTRKVGSNYVQVTNVSPGVDRFNFEDKGSDFDYNDVIVTVDHQSCANVVFTAQLGDAAWHHVIRAEVYYEGTLRKDQLLWSDSHNAENAPQNVDFSTDQNVCEGAPPDITNVRAHDITATHAIVSWDTLGSLSNSLVEYGTTAGYGQSVTAAAMVTQHSLVLPNLTKGTLYHYRVTSTDGNNNTAISQDFTFTTLTDDVAPANVGGLTAVAGDAVVHLSWTNPPDADFAGVKVLRKTTSYPTGPTDGTLVYQGPLAAYDDLAVTNGVTYYYAVFAYDDVPNYSSGALANATPSGAPDATAPANVTSLNAVAGDSVVTLSWTNSASVDAQGTRLVRKLGSNPTGPMDGTLVYQGTNTTFVDTGVVNGTQYFYGAFAYDAVPNYASGAFANATPSATADTTPPAPVTSLDAVAGDAMVMLTWTNPTTPDWAGTIVLRKTGGYPTGPTDGTIVFDGVGSSKMDNFVTNGTQYYYSAYAYDATPNYAAPATDTATPVGGLPPPPTPMCADSDGGRNYDTSGTTTRESTSQTDSCSDGLTVTEWYCDANDQVASESHGCGSGYKCSTDRCVPEDFVPSQEICGNAICAGSENSINCAIDCPVATPVPPVEEPPVTVPPGQEMEATDLRFYATSGRIQLRLRNGDTLRFYTNSVFTVMIPDPAIQEPIARAFVTFDGKSYAMRQTASFEASIITPGQEQTLPMVVAVEYANGQTDAVHINVELVNRPRVISSADGAPLVGARVTLLVDEGGGNYGVWNGATYGQQNPQFTDDLGRYGFIVPIGAYRLVVEKEGYRTKETLPFPNSNENVVGMTVELIPLPPPDDLPAQVEYVVEVVQDIVREFIDNVYVEEGAGGIAAPAATIATIANVAAAGVATASVFFLPSYLLSLLAHPFLLIARRRRKQWGVVYNSLSKLPIDLAIVRLIDARTGRILRSAVTDKAGRYFFIVQPGQYKIVAVKNAYVFPSDVLRGVKEDQKYVDLYHGEVIAVTSEATITANIPLDPLNAEKSPSRIRWEGIGRRLQRALGIFAILAMIVATVISPTPLMIALLVANVFMYFFFRRLSVARKPKNWGIVYDDKSKKPLQNVVARIFDSRFNKLLETQVTDSRGRYAFLVGQNTYYVTFEKLGYEKTQKGPVDLVDTKKTTTHLVAVDVPLIYTGKKAASILPHVTPPPMPAMPPQPARLPDAPAPAPKPPAAPPSAPAAPAAGASDYAAKMMARLAPKAPAATPKAPDETIEQIVKDLRDAMSGTRNGHELPTADQAHPPEPPAAPAAKPPEEPKK